MPLPIISKPSHDWGPVRFIVERLRACGNTGKSKGIFHAEAPVKRAQRQQDKKNLRSERGRQAELRVRHYLSQLGWIPVVERWRSPWGEVDGIYYRAGKILLVEVKSTRSDWCDEPVSFIQRQRLVAVFNEMIEQFPQYKIELWLALVFSNQQVQIVTDYFGES